MKKILLFSTVFLVTGTCLLAQERKSKKTANCHKMVACKKKPSPDHDKTLVYKKQKQVSLQKTNLQPVVVPAALVDERAN